MKNYKLKVHRKVAEVVDGDTFKVVVGIPYRGNKRYYVRIADIDAPEKNTKAGKLAKAKLEHLILGKVVLLKILGSDAYSRILADVYLSGHNLKDLLGYK